MVWVRIGMSEPQPAGFKRYLVPGTHQVELFSRTPQVTNKTVQVVAGKTVEVTIPVSSSSPVALSAATTPEKDGPRPAPDRAEARPFPTALVALGAGLTLAAAGTSAFLYARQSSKSEDAKAFPRTDPNYARLRNEHQDARTLYQPWAGDDGSVCGGHDRRRARPCTG